MKKILTVATGGTIGSSLIGGCRRLNTEVAQSTLLSNFFASSSFLATTGEELFADSGYKNKTLSENMTPEKLFDIYRHIRSFDLSDYEGVIILHGTDTLAYTAAFLSVALCDTPIPVILVSGNRPPDMEDSNANHNFRCAAELIARELSPNVYAVYRNSDGKTYLHLGSTLMQCPNFSEDFRSASEKNAAMLDGDNALSAELLDRLRELSEDRHIKKFDLHATKGNAMLLNPYVGLDYSRIDLDGVDGIVQGSYHSGTFCAQGADSPYSFIGFAMRCAERGIPVYVAPCVIDENQYESVYEAKNYGIIPLSYTAELAFSKLLIGLSMELSGNSLYEFMTEIINNEYVKNEDNYLNTKSRF